MGLNISGLVINKNYSEDISELEKAIGEKLIFEKEVLFEEAAENWKSDHYCDIYYSNKGTLVFLSFERGGFDFSVDKQIAFSFVLSEMTGLMCVNYTSDGEMIRSLMEEDEGISVDEGIAFDFEKSEDDKSELIYHLIETTLGESFHDIEFEGTCYRYSFEGAEVEADNVTSEPKPWWKFW